LSTRPTERPALTGDGLVELPVKLDLYTFVGLYSKALKALVQILTKGAAYASDIGASEKEMLAWRIAPDMFPLLRQAQIVCDLAVKWTARSAGLAPPEAPAVDQSAAELHAAIEDARNFLERLRPEQLEGRHEVPLKLQIGELEPTMPLGQWVSGFATTNFCFHLSMAYAILRMKGVPLGKRDLLAGGL
jgi:hypothetical protein